MGETTVLYIVLAASVALLMAFFQYRHHKKSYGTWLTVCFIFLRFTSLFALLLLVINPKIKQRIPYIEKPNLVIALDNSKSIDYMGQKKPMQGYYNALMSNQALQEKFKINSYIFDSSIKPLDSLSLTGQQTNISKALDQLTDIYKTAVAPIILMTDGNQSYGRDYSFSKLGNQSALYPVVVGDTASYTDLKIKQLNTNKYAYLSHQFPVEVMTAYTGRSPVKTTLEIYSGKRMVYSKPISFSEKNNSKIIQLNLPANKVGVRTFRASIRPIETEKNKINNSKNFAVEIIDQKTKIAIVSTIIHPDLGALKTSITHNEQREVSFLKPPDALSQINNYQLFILYQPTKKFESLFEALNSQNRNRFVISGPKTDLTFLNTATTTYSQELTAQKENYQATQNLQYTPFFIEPIGAASFPPLEANFGKVSFNIPYETIFYKTLAGQTLDAPLWATFEVGKRREAVLFGEHLWKWRAQSYLDSKSFTSFDNFIDKIIQYLASGKSRTRLSLDYKSFYNGATPIRIKAQFFDKNYNFDTRESLQISLTNTRTGTQQTLPFVLKNTNYEVDLSSLNPGNYKFVVRATHARISKSGTFEILDYNVEQQFVNANAKKLERLANRSKGATFFVNNQPQALVDTLLNDSRYRPIQKSHKKIISLIDLKTLLGLIALALAMEWFLRKYNGLI